MDALPTTVFVEETKTVTSIPAPTPTKPIDYLDDETVNYMVEITRIMEVFMSSEDLMMELMEPVSVNPAYLKDKDWISDMEALQNTYNEASVAMSKLTPPQAFDPEINNLVLNIQNEAARMLYEISLAIEVFNDDDADSKLSVDSLYDKTESTLYKIFVYWGELFETLRSLDIYPVPTIDGYTASENNLYLAETRYDLVIYSDSLEKLEELLNNFNENEDVDNWSFLLRLELDSLEREADSIKSHSPPSDMVIAHNWLLEAADVTYLMIDNLIFSLENSDQDAYDAFWGNIEEVRFLLRKWNVEITKLLHSPEAKSSETSDDMVSRGNDIGVSLEYMQNIFEEYGFVFQPIPADEGEVSVLGEFGNIANVTLSSRNSNLVDVYYSRSIPSDPEEYLTPSGGDIFIDIFGENVYKNDFSPWGKENHQNNSNGFENPLCLDGLVIASYYSEFSDSTILSIMLEEEWKFTKDVCK
jgi:hypothetical protein